MTIMNARSAYRLGAGVAVVTVLLTIWSTIVRDDGNGIGFLMLVMAAAVASAAARFEAAGMARAMAGVAIMQAALAGLLATAPSVINAPGGASKIVQACIIAIVLWLFAAGCFQVAAKAYRQAAY